MKILSEVAKLLEKHIPQDKVLFSLSRKAETYLESINALNLLIESKSNSNYHNHYDSF